MTLTDPTDEQLNRAFIKNVTDWSPKIGAPGPLSWKLSLGENHPDFCSSADAVLPWLEKQRWVKGDIDRDQDGGVYVESGNGIWNGCDEPFSFPKRAVIALLRREGIQVIFTGQ